MLRCKSISTAVWRNFARFHAFRLYSHKPLVISTRLPLAAHHPVSHFLHRAKGRSGGWLVRDWMRGSCFGSRGRIMLPLRTARPASSQRSSLCCDVLKILLQSSATLLCIFGLPFQSARPSGRTFLAEMRCLNLRRGSYMRAYKLQPWVHTRSAEAPSMEDNRAGQPQTARSVTVLDAPRVADRVQYSRG